MNSAKIWNSTDRLVVVGLVFFVPVIWIFVRSTSAAIDIWDALDYLNSGYSYILHGTSMPHMIRIGVLEDLGSFPVGEVHYPNTLFSLLIGAFSVFFFEYPSELSAYILACGFSSLGVASLYVLARNFLPQNSSLLFVTATILSPLLWHTLTRPLTDPIAWGLLLFTAAYAVSEHRKTIIVAVLLTALILVRFPMFIVIPFFSLLLMKPNSWRSLVIQLALLMVAIAVFYLAYVTIFNRMFLPNQSAHDLDNAASFYTSFAANSLGKLSIENILWQIGHVFGLIVKFSIGGPLILYLLVTMGALFVFIRQRQASRIALLLAFILMIAFVVIAVPSAYLAYRTWLGIDPRYFIYATPFLTFGAWLAYDQIRKQRPKLAKTLEIGSCVLAMIALPFALTSPQGERYFPNTPSWENFVEAVTATDLKDVYQNATTWFGNDPLIVTNFNSVGINAKTRTVIYVPEVETFQNSPVASQVNGIIATNLNGTDWDIQRVCSVDNTCFKRVYTSPNANFFAFRREDTSK